MCGLAIPLLIAGALLLAALLFASVGRGLFSFCLEVGGVVFWFVLIFVGLVLAVILGVVVAGLVGMVRLDFRFWILGF